ncbi:Transcriptional regulatory protein TdiR [Georgfuchsia toluolica]|uniref:Transcriptional regulatory protein TdiR n=1 Tax=Georgfuchsia toluolica TaxID=424218 RepID=A0A916J469_9PROT|nr:response regulator [Georgfuchsia toluolica]CAG4883889.1 Transcriptional regulatory protein TdiR [Georgfuchsia toluolica]
MNEQPPVTVFIIDDEPEVSAALVWLLESVKINARAFQAGEDLLRELASFKAPACAVLDLRMPGISGLELLQRMIDMGCRIPVLFLSAHGDVPAAVNAMQLGAIDFLQKPFNSQEFLNSVNRAITLARETYAQQLRESATQKLLTRLSEREKDVLQHVLRGQTSKQIAKLLGISPKTVDVHRANIMRKLDVTTYPDLVNKVRGDTP